MVCPLNLRVGELVYVEPHTANLGALGVIVAHVTTEVSNKNGVIIFVVNAQSKDVRLKSGLIVGQIHTIKEESVGVFTTIAGQHIL